MVDVLWLAKNLETDKDHRVVTDEQIAKWDKGTPDPIDCDDCNKMITTGVYYHTTLSTNGPMCDETGVDAYGNVVKVNVGNGLISQNMEAAEVTGAETLGLRKFTRVGVFPAGETPTESNIEWLHWYEINTTKIMTKDELAEYYLVDFTYEKDTDTGNYVLTGWKGTYNGEPSTLMIIPDTTDITIEI